MKHILLALIIPFLTAQPTLTSRCIERGSVAEEVDKSTAMFSGKAIAEEYRRLESDGVGEVLVVRIKVERVWKGEIGDTVVMYTRMLKGQTSVRDEDFNFKVGESYLVYAYGSLAKLKTNGCTRTKLLKNAEEDLQALGEGRKVETER